MRYSQRNSTRIDMPHTSRHGTAHMHTHTMARVCVVLLVSPLWVYGGSMHVDDGQGNIVHQTRGAFSAAVHARPHTRIQPSASVGSLRLRGGTHSNVLSAPLACAERAHEGGRVSMNLQLRGGVKLLSSPLASPSLQGKRGGPGKGGGAPPSKWGGLTIKTSDGAAKNTQRRGKQGNGPLGAAGKGESEGQVKKKKTVRGLEGFKVPPPPPPPRPPCT